MTNSEKNYLYDLGQELVALATRIDSESKRENDQFQRGRRFSLYEVLNLMKQQAVAFELSDQQLGLEGIEIEMLLR